MKEGKEIKEEGNERGRREEDGNVIHSKGRNRKRGKKRGKIKEGRKKK